MTWRTHLVGGIGTLWLLAPVPGVYRDLGVMAAAAALGALLPDLDAAQSRIRSLRIGGIQPFDPIGAVANRTLGHRGFLHSISALIMVALLAGICAVWTGWHLATALWLGYASHLALDACTKSGIPGRKGRLFLVPPMLRIVTGSPEEDMYFAVLATACVALLLPVMRDASGIPDNPASHA